MKTSLISHVFWIINTAVLLQLVFGNYYISKRYKEYSGKTQRNGQMSFFILQSFLHQQRQYIQNVLLAYSRKTRPFTGTNKIMHRDSSFILSKQDMVEEKST